MKQWMVILAAGLAFLGTATLGFADHHNKGEAGTGMPEVGPPKEMKRLERMNGEYAVKFYYKVDPASEGWAETAATAVLSTVVGGGAQQMVFEGELMGMPFSGIGLNSYDRETRQWQSVWVDSMGARISVYTGSFEDGKLVVTGKDMAQGMTMDSRLTTYDITDEGFEWSYEMSMDGTNFVETAKATYTRK